MTKRETRIAAVVLTLVACAIAVVLWGLRLDDGSGRIGPMKVLRAGGQEWVAYFLGDRFSMLDAQGHRVARQALGELRLTEEPTDIDFSVDAQGRVQAWLFEDTLPRIVRCELVPQHMRLERCVQAMAGAQLKTDPRSRAVHIAVDAARERLFVADANGGARALSLDGRRIADSPPGTLFFPNRIRVDGDALVVADNDHRRLVWLDVSGERPAFAPKRVLTSSSHGQARSDRLKVTDFVHRAPSGGRDEVLWMLAVAQGQKHGDVLLFGPDSKPQARADTGGFGDPLMIDALGGGIVAADFEGVALYRIDDRGGFAGEFGDAATREEFARARADVERARWVTRAGWSLLAASIVLGFVLAFKYGERPMPAIASAAFEPGAADAAPVVLAPDPRFTRRIGWLVAVGVVAAFVALLGPWWVVARSRPDSPGIPLGWPLVLAGALVLVMATSFTSIWRQMQHHLVASAEGLQVRWRDKVQAQAAWGDVWASDQALLVGRTTIAYRQVRLGGAAGAWIFPEELLMRHVLARVPPHQRVPARDFVWRSLRQTWRWQHALLALALLAYVGWELWRLLR